MVTTSKKRMKEVNGRSGRVSGVLAFVLCFCCRMGFTAVTDDAILGFGRLANHGYI